MKIIAVDFDGTLVDNKWPDIGMKNWKLFSYLINCRKCGIKLILYTMREGEKLEQAVEFCKANGLEFDAVNDNLEEMKQFYGNNPRKIYCDWLIDDKVAIVNGLGRRLPDLKNWGSSK